MPNPPFCRSIVALTLLGAFAACRPEVADKMVTTEDVSVSASENDSALPKGTMSMEECAAGWISLFDGETLFGWTPGSDANWHVEDGTIVVSSGEKGLLCTTFELTDYVLKAEFQAEPATNSGIFLRTPIHPTDPKQDCYELNIAPAENPFPTASIVGRKKADGETQGTGWRTFEVTLEGSHIAVKLDDRLVLDYDEPQPLKQGHIGLQLNEGRVAFRNLRLMPLGLEPMLNGRDLSGWKEYPDLPSKFTVAPDGILNVKNGRGQLETTASYANFAMQLECMTHASKLNSGVFYRCIPGEQMNGYEVQIHNGFNDNDRRKPIDHGTGAIFRREPARIVAANDQQWFGMTIIAEGPHVSTWVNGLQVVDWTDTRPPDKNPRNGLRLEGGTIMLQGHDPTTDISFRNLRIKELGD